MKTSMKLLAAGLLTATALAAQAQVGVSISIGQPGFYGQIDLGNAPPPQVIYPQPMFVSPVPNPLPAIYLHVPAGYQTHWRRYCRQYNACNRPVYFVSDAWYQHNYVPYYRTHYDAANRRWNDARGPARGPVHDAAPPPRGHDDRGQDDHGRGQKQDRDNRDNRDNHNN